MRKTCVLISILCPVVVHAQYEILEIKIDADSIPYDTVSIEYYNKKDLLIKKSNKYVTSTYEYKQGILKSEIDVSTDDGKIIDQVKYTIKKKRPAIKYFYNEKGENYGRYEYQYDKKGNEVAQKYITGDGLIWHWKSTYNSQNQIVLLETYSKTGEKVSDRTYGYDEKGREIKYHIKDVEGSIYGNTNQSYHSSYYPNGNLKSTWIEKTQGGGKYHLVEYYYNEHNELIMNVDHGMYSSGNSITIYIKRNSLQKKK